MLAQPYRRTRITRLEVGLRVMYSTVLWLIYINPEVFVLFKGVLVVMVALIKVILLAHTLRMIPFVQSSQNGSPFFTRPAFL